LLEPTDKNFVQKNNFVNMKLLRQLSTALTLIALLVSPEMFGQNDFAQLSAKDRIKIAEQEELDARKDAEFQRIMQTGHDLFKQKHYLKAIHKYEEAQEKRPYNVYPKVIIADIELSMKDTLAVLRKAEQTEKKQSATKEKLQPEPEPETNVETEEERLRRLEEWERMEREKRAAERERQKELEKPATKTIEGDVPVITKDEFREELGSKYPSGMTEEVTSEGNKTITKRIKVANGKGDEYKRVVHGWGGVFYFKNGEAVTERVWVQETEN
jgi:hypothetical protein